MGTRYMDGTDLPNLATVCRRTGYPVIEVGSRSTPGTGWQHRSRSSGGYENGRPNHIIAHHTAGSSDGWDLANYLTFDHQDRPCANLSLMRDGAIYVQAGGASNHAGKGKDPCSPDVTPEDSANSHSIGIEAANRGDCKESWPAAQRDSYVRLCGELCKAYGIPVSRIHGHVEWAPDRKIDPAGGPDYQSPPYNGPGGGSCTWTLDTFRADVQAYINGGTVPPPNKETVTVTLDLPVLRKGDSGQDVRRMQHLLGAAGWTATFNGVWDDVTDTAKAGFDEAVGLGDPNDTSCGAKSWESLLTGRVW